jgi:large subunit ribosomal protein L29
MKSTDYLKQLRGKTAEQLAEEQAALQKERFNLRLAQATGQQTQTHLTRVARKKLARVNTLLKQQTRQQAKS